MNYWFIEKSELPSRGLYYDPDFEIKIRPMNVEEVKYLATFNKDNATIIVNEILKKCLKLTKLKFNDIIIGDREYLIFWIRTNSFITNSGYKIEIPKCPICKNSYEHEIKLGTFKTDYLYKQVNSIKLPNLEIELPIKQPTIKDLSEMINDGDEISEYAMFIDSVNTVKDKIRFIENLSGDDFSELKYNLDGFKCGMHKEIMTECPICHNFQPVKILLNESSLFPNTKLKDILEHITRVAKYTNLTITNDWPWVEVEIELEIVNNMIKEENERNQKEMAKAKSKAHIPSTPHIPNMPRHY